jgi:hypothetical protein
MDGGQVALDAEGKQQLSAWMSDEGGQRKLFVARVEPGKAPEGSSLVDFPGRQGHPVIAPIDENRALVVFEANDTIGAIVIGENGKVVKKAKLADRGRFPRLVRTESAVVAAWESDDGIQVITLKSDWWDSED